MGCWSSNMTTKSNTPFDLNSLTLMEVQIDGQTKESFFISEDRSVAITAAIDNLKKALGADEPVPG